MLIGQEKLQSALMRQALAGRPVHAYLFCGAEGSGKRTAAVWWAQTLLCLDIQEEGPCGKCGCCIRFQSGNHPDYTYIAADQGKAEGGVDRIRSLLEEVSIKPYEGRRKITVIARADRLTPQAQNALLKSLEEPPAYAVFILTADNPQMLLPTVRSRCEILHMQPVAREVLAEAVRARVRAVSPDRIAAACAMSGGCIGRALELVEDEGLFAQRAEAFRNLCAVLDMKQQQIPAALAVFKAERETVVALLSFWLSMLRDALCMRMGIPPLENGDYADELERRARPFTTGQLKGMMNTVYQTQKRILGNANVAMAAERMLSEWVEEKG